jgi:hypothetical protein
MARRANGFEQLPEAVKLAAFTRLIEEKLGRSIGNLREFCDSGLNMVRIIDALVPGEPVPKPRMTGQGDVLKRQQREYALTIAFRRGILQDDRTQKWSPAVMDMTLPNANQLLNLLQAIANKADIRLSSYVPTDLPAKPTPSDTIEHQMLTEFRARLSALETRVRNAMKTLDSLPSAIPTTKANLIELNTQLNGFDVEIREVESSATSLSTADDKHRIEQIRLLLGNGRYFTLQRMEDITATCDLIDQYRLAAQQLAEATVQNIQNLGSKLLERPKSLWDGIINACKCFQLAIPEDFGTLAFPALEGQFQFGLCQSFDRLCDEILNQRSELNKDSLILVRQNISDCWANIVREKLEGKTHHTGPDVISQLNRIDVDLVSKGYQECANQVWAALNRVKSQIERCNPSTMNFTVYLTQIAEAQVAARPDVLIKPEMAW